jgi:hypothetical protein
LGGRLEGRRGSVGPRAPAHVNGGHVGSSVRSGRAVRPCGGSRAREMGVSHDCHALRPRRGSRAREMGVPHDCHALRPRRGSRAREMGVPHD